MNNNILSLINWQLLIGPWKEKTRFQITLVCLSTSPNYSNRQNNFPRYEKKKKKNLDRFHWQICKRKEKSRSKASLTFPSRFHISRSSIKLLLIRRAIPSATETFSIFRKEKFLDESSVHFISPTPTSNSISTQLS